MMIKIDTRIMDLLAAREITLREALIPFLQIVDCFHAFETP